MRKTARLGIGISSDSVRVVLTSGTSIRWAREACVESGRTLEVTLTDILSHANVKRFPRPQTFVALGPGVAWVKSLAGVPPLAEPSLTTQMIRTNATRFFPQIWDRQVVAAVNVDAETNVWAVSVSEALVEQVLGACRSAGLKEISFVPTVMTIALLGPKTESERSVVWYDGTIETTIQVASNGVPSSVDHVRLNDNDAPNRPQPSLNVELETIGSGGHGFADAYGAALLGPSVPLRFVQSVLDVAAEGALFRSRHRIGLLVCAAAIIVALVGPLLLPTYRRIQTENRIAAISVAAMGASATETELRKQSLAVRVVDRFYTGSPSPTAFLYELTQALPGGIAIVSLRFDSAGGSLLVIGDHVIRALETVDSLPQILAAQVASPVTREMLNGRELERLGLRFEFRRDLRGERASDSQ